MTGDERTICASDRERGHFQSFRRRRGGSMSVEERIREEAAALEREWQDERWSGIRRDYGAEDVVRLRGSVRVEHTLARRGAEQLWETISAGEYVHALGAYSGAQAVQMAKAGLRSIYLSGWQVAGD